MVIFVGHSLSTQAPSSFEPENVALAVWQLAHWRLPSRWKPARRVNHVCLPESPQPPMGMYMYVTIYMVCISIQKNISQVCRHFQIFCQKDSSWKVLRIFVRHFSHLSTLLPHRTWGGSGVKYHQTIGCHHITNPKNAILKSTKSPDKITIQICMKSFYILKKSLSHFMTPFFQTQPSTATTACHLGGKMLNFFILQAIWDLVASQRFDDVA